MTGLDERTPYVRRSDLQAVDMDGDLVMMGLEQGEYYGLRATAASLWTHLEQPRTVDELCELLTTEYDVTPDDCRPDVVGFLRDLVDRGLVEPAG